MNDVETAGMTIRMAELKKEHEQATKDIGETKDPADILTKSAEIQRIENEFDILTRAVDLSGTEKGRALVAQKLTINKNFDLISVLNRAKVASGKELSVSQRQEFTKLTKELEAANKTIEDMQSQAKVEQAKSVIKRGRKRIKSLSLAERNRNFNNLVSETIQLIEQGCNN